MCRFLSRDGFQGFWISIVKVLVVGAVPITCEVHATLRLFFSPGLRRRCPTAPLATATATGTGAPSPWGSWRPPRAASNCSSRAQAEGPRDQRAVQRLHGLQKTGEAQIK